MKIFWKQNKVKKHFFNFALVGSKNFEAKRSINFIFLVIVQNACETDLVSLRFALKQKIFLGETGCKLLCMLASPSGWLQYVLACWPWPFTRIDVWSFLSWTLACTSMSKIRSAYWSAANIKCVLDYLPDCFHVYHNVHACTYKYCTHAFFLICIR